MSDCAQVLQFKPSSELIFSGPSDKAPTAVLQLCNPTVDIVAFRIRTPAPGCYSVRSPCGFVEPHSTVSVTIFSLLPFKSAVRANRHNVQKRHRFSVYSFVVKSLSETERVNPDSLWIKAAKREDVMSYRLNVGESRCTRKYLRQNRTDSKVFNLSNYSNGSEQQKQKQQHKQQRHQQQRELEAQLHHLRRENAKLCEEELRLRKSELRRSIRRQPQLRQEANAVPKLPLISEPILACYDQLQELLTEAQQHEKYWLLICVSTLAIGTIIGKFYI